MPKTKDGSASKRLERLFDDYDEAKEALNRLLAGGIEATLDRQGSSWSLVAEAPYTVAHSTDPRVSDVPAAGAAPTNQASRLLENSAVWLYTREHDLVESFASQLNAGRTLTKRQNAALAAIEEAVTNRGAPRFVGGYGLRRR